ncbi:MAG: hypothetical protein QM756_44240 [Polyangiaceae bacterium]
MTRPPSKARTGGGLLAALLICSPACGGETVVLGQAEPTPARFGPATVVAELFEVDSGNPTLTDDQLEIYFSSKRTPPNSDVWCATRSSPTARFNAPVPVTAVNSDMYFETSPAISPDGLTLWFGSNRPADMIPTGIIAVWVSTRSSRSAEFGAPRLVTELSSGIGDVPRPLGEHGSVMPLSSNRTSPDWYSTLLTSFDARSNTFSAAVGIPELNFSDRSTTDGFLSNDGLSLFFASGGKDQPMDLYVARRKSTSAAFTVIQAIDTLNTLNDERDPFMTRDGRHFDFSSNRDYAPELAIYEASVLSP